MVANFALAVMGPSGGRSCTQDSDGCGSGENVRGGTLKACSRRFWSTSCENVVSRRRVRIWVNGGASMRSDVSSRRRRSEGELVGEGCCGEDWDMGGEGLLVLGVGSAEPDGGEGEALMPDSRRTVSSWSGGGSRYWSQPLCLLKKG